MEDEKKLIILKIIHFRAYRPVAAIDNDSEEDVQMQKIFFFTKNALCQSDALSFIILAKESEATANKISKEEEKYPLI